ncbi:hypothetical protein KA005_57975 [bacterium]|nr:hypothetical protein [bacterium]
MLIKTDRHTKQDLELWEELEEIDLIKIHDLKEEKIQRAISEIKEAAKSKSYISVSWGKDSIVTAHLCYLAGIILPLVWIKEMPMENPYCKDVRDKFLKQYDFPYHEIVADYGHAGFTPFLDKNGDSLLFHGIANGINHAFGRRITGIRNEESGRRLLRYMNYGHNTKKTSAPISLWKSWEIFSYLKMYNLPVHPNYAMLGNGRYDRFHLRVDCLGGTQGDNMGRTEWEKEYYQDILNRIIT